MRNRYQLVKIYTSEDVSWRGKPVDQAILEFLKEQQAQIRCLVVRCDAGYSETGGVVFRSASKLALKMPLKIELTGPAGEVKRLLPKLGEIVSDGLITLEKTAVFSCNCSERLIPKQLQVQEVMTAKVETVSPVTPVEQVVRKMLANSLKGIPVIDDIRRVIGIITQQNLSDHPHLPLRLGLLARLDPKKAEAFLERLPLFNAGEIMTQPVVTVGRTQHVADAAQIMLEHHLKRLPVVDEENVLVGMIARIDILRAVRQQIAVHRRSGEGPLRERTGLVRDIGDRETESVLPETAVTEVLELIFKKDIQRVAVVDDRKRLLGIISDRDLLPLLGAGNADAEEFFINIRNAALKGRWFRDYLERTTAQTAAEVMNRNVISVTEDSPVDDAVRLMVDRELKRLPVVDAAGAYRGMITREALLKAVSK